MHKFAYPYRYWGVNISALAAGQVLPEVKTPTISKRIRFKGLPLFSAQHKALQQFCAEDYLMGLDGSEDVDGNNGDSNDNTANIPDNAMTAVTQPKHPLKN